jgi:hypothetical protein
MAVARCCCWCAAAWLLSATAVGILPREYYVDPAGNDLNDGLTLATAWRSLDRGQPTQLRDAAPSGAESLAVARAVQLPPSGVVRVVFGPHAPPGIPFKYSSRDGFHLYGVQCSVAGEASDCPALPVGAAVHSQDAPPPEPGSTIKVSAGVFAFPPNSTTAAALPLAHYDAAYFMSSNLTLQGTIDASGRPLSVIDGRSLSREAVTVDSASHVTLTGFDIRRGAVYVNQADGFTITHSRVHHSTGGVSIAYSNNVTVSQCIIFDITNGARADAIAIHRGTDYALIQNNTVTNSDYCVHVYAGSATDAQRPGAENAFLQKAFLS